MSLKFALYLLKSLWGHRARTLLTVSGSAVALLVFGLIQASQRGLENLTRDPEATRTLVVFQANRFCPVTSRLPENYATAIGKIAGVREVIPAQVFVNNCRASLDLVVFQGLPPEKLRQKPLQLVAGDWESFERLEDGALVGQALARRRNLSPGQKFVVGEISVTVAAVFASTPAEENQAYTRLRFLQLAPGRNMAGLVTLLEAKLEPDADPEQVAQAIDARFRGGPVPTDTRTRGAFQAGVVADLAELIRWAGWLGYACVGLVLALVATTTVMAVQDRVREHALLQALGFSPARVFGLVLCEGLLVSLAGGLLGIGSALGVLAWANPALGTEGVAIALVPSLGLALQGLAVAAGVGLLASLIPAWNAARADIVRALREL